MASQSDAEMGINSWLEDELYQQYRHDRSTVDESWKKIFEGHHPNGGSLANGGTATNGATTAPVRAAVPAATQAPAVAGDQWQPLRGAAGRIAENMAASVAIPLATS